MSVYLVTLTIDNGCRNEKIKILIPIENATLAVEKAIDIYNRKYAGYEDVVVNSEVQLVSDTTEYVIIK